MIIFEDIFLLERFLENSLGLDVVGIKVERLAQVKHHLDSAFGNSIIFCHFKNLPIYESSIRVLFLVTVNIGESVKGSLDPISVIVVIDVLPAFPSSRQ